MTMRPIDAAWQFLKADPRTQMFLPYSQHRGRMNLSEPEMKNTQLGAVHPAVQGMAYRQMLRNMGLAGAEHSKPSLEQLASAMGDMDLRGMDASLHGGDHTVDADGTMYHDREPVSGHAADFTGPGSMAAAGMLGGRRPVPGNEMRLYNTASTMGLPVETQRPDIRSPQYQLDLHDKVLPALQQGALTELMHGGEYDSIIDSDETAYLPADALAAIMTNANSGSYQTALANQMPYVDRSQPVPSMYGGNVMDLM